MPTCPRPSCSLAFARTAFVAIIALGELAKLSARNRFPARIEELVPRHGHIFAALSVADQRLWAEVTKDAVKDLGMAPGVEVTCLVKTAALEVLE